MGGCSTPWFPYPGLEGPKPSRMCSPEFFLSCPTLVIQFIHQIFTERNTIMCQEHYSILGTWNKISYHPYPLQLLTRSQRCPNGWRLSIPPRP